MQKVSEKQEHWLESCIDMISGLVRANISNGQQVAYMSSYPIFVLILLHICVLILLSGLVRANISNGQQVADLLTLQTLPTYMSSYQHIYT
jgi:type II secretory pathway component PulF